MTNSTTYYNFVNEGGEGYTPAVSDKNPTTDPRRLRVELMFAKGRLRDLKNCDATANGSTARALADKIAQIESQLASIK